MAPTKLGTPSATGHAKPGVPDLERADPQRYAQMAAGTRALQLAGYEVRRFGGHELVNREHAGRLLDDFFARLLDGARSHG